jgi:hypothetical protein
MRRELCVGQQCEHITRTFEDGKVVKTACSVKHNDRSEGPPKQLVPVKVARETRFMCLTHAPMYRKGDGVYRRVKKAPPEEQISLL